MNHHDANTAAGHTSAPRNETYKHLQDPMRLGGLTLGQWTALCGSALAAIVFGLYLSPLPPGATIGISLFVAGLPIALSYAVSGVDLGLSDTLAAIYRWTRSAKHYLPGGGDVPAGYVVQRPLEDGRHAARPPADVAAARAQLEGAWDL